MQDSRERVGIKQKTGTAGSKHAVEHKMDCSYQQVPNLSW